MNKKLVTKELIGYFEDIEDCLFTSDKLVAYYTRRMHESYVKYELHDEASRAFDFDSKIQFYIHCFLKYHGRDRVTKFTIVAPEGYLCFTVYYKKFKVIQAHEDFFSGNLTYFEDDLRMDEADWEILERVKKSCTKINSDYW